MESIKQAFLITLYEHIAEEVRFSKRQQMNATWYALLLYAAIVYTHTDWFGETKWLPIAFSVLLFFVGFGFMCSCSISQKNNNNRVKHVRRKFNLPEEMTGDKWDIIPCYYKATCLSYFYYNLFH